MNNPTLGIGERIKKRRKELKLSADYIALKLNIDRSTVYRYESNEISKLNILHIKTLADILDVSPSYLMGWEDEPSTGHSFSYKYITESMLDKLAINPEQALTSEVKSLNIPDVLMGKWAKNNDIFIIKMLNDEINIIIPPESLIAFQVTNMDKLQDRDIAVYSYRNELSIRYFFNDKQNERYILKPNSLDSYYHDIIVNHSEKDNLKMIGKVAIYIVNQ